MEIKETLDDEAREILQAILAEETGDASGAIVEVMVQERWVENRLKFNAITDVEVYELAFSFKSEQQVTAWGAVMVHWLDEKSWDVEVLQSISPVG